MDTESVLQNWRYGPTQAERLVAALLHVEEFEDVDPQHPLGGPDGLKDVLCTKSGLVWVAAAYLPGTSTNFREIRNKFEHDFAGVAKNNASAFAFFVNQPLTIGERQDLIALAGGIRVELYHLERLTSLLNSPKGCGIRLEYLRIVMTEPEQWAFWSTMNVDVVRKLVDNEKLHDAQLQKLSDKIDSFMERTNALIENLRAGPSSLTRPVDRIEMPTSSLSASMLCWIHRVLTEGDGQSEAVRGRFRAVQTWIGPAGATTQTASFVPPPPEQIPGRISVFLDWWRAEYPDLIDADRDSIIAALAEFHQRFLAIHPFLDANGRVARCLLDQAARELLNQGIGQDFTADTEGYFGTLKSANKGDFSALEARIAASLQ